jgi:hypothetical protein
MSQQTDELKNIIASLTNIVAALEAAEADVPLAPEVPEATETPSEDEGDAAVPAPAPDPGTPDAPAAAEATPEATTIPVTDGAVADNTPSATVTVG